MGRLLKLWRVAGNDLRFLMFAMRHPGRPGWLWPAAALLAFYALEPLNVALPLLGVVDELVVMPLLLHGMLKLLPSDLRRDFALRQFRAR